MGMLSHTMVFQPRQTRARLNGKHRAKISVYLARLPLLIVLIFLACVALQAFLKPATHHSLPHTQHNGISTGGQQQNVVGDKIAGTADSGFSSAADGQTYYSACSKGQIEFSVPGLCIPLRTALTVATPFLPQELAAFQSYRQHSALQRTQQQEQAAIVQRLSDSLLSEEQLLEAGSSAHTPAHESAGTAVVFVGVISTCCTEQAKIKHSSIRTTWLQKLRTQYPAYGSRFFLSQPWDAQQQKPATASQLTALQPLLQAEADSERDLVILRGGDFYRNLPNKSLRMLEYALMSTQQYTHVLKVDDDCYVRVPQLLKALQFGKVWSSVSEAYGQELHMTESLQRLKAATQHSMVKKVQKAYKASERAQTGNPNPQETLPSSPQSLADPLTDSLTDSHTDSLTNTLEVAVDTTTARNYMSDMQQETGTNRDLQQLDRSESGSNAGSLVGTSTWQLLQTAQDASSTQQEAVAGGTTSAQTAADSTDATTASSKADDPLLQLVQSLKNAADSYEAQLHVAEQQSQYILLTYKDMLRKLRAQMPTEGQNSTQPVMRNLYLGASSGRGGFVPVRDPVSKWYLSPEQLPDAEAPIGLRYLAGWGYVLSRDTAEHAVQAARRYGWPLVQPGAPEAQPGVGTLPNHAMLQAGAPKWFAALPWEDVLVGALVRGHTGGPVDSLAFRDAWRSCPNITAVRHLDIDAPRLLPGLHAQDESGLWDLRPVQCTSGTFMYGNYEAWRQWRDSVPGVLKV